MVGIERKKMARLEFRSVHSFSGHQRISFTLVGIFVVSAIRTHRTKILKKIVSNKWTVAMVYPPTAEAQKSWLKTSQVKRIADLHKWVTMAAHERTLAHFINALASNEMLRSWHMCDLIWCMMWTGARDYQRRFWRTKKQILWLACSSNGCIKRDTHESMCATVWTAHRHGFECDNIRVHLTVTLMIIILTIWQLCSLYGIA